MNLCPRCRWLASGECGTHQRARIKAERKRAMTEHRAWFERTRHCGQCGNPGSYCTCYPGQPCGCAGLHEVGSARRDGALAAFTAPDDDQPDLFPGREETR